MSFASLKASDTAEPLLPAEKAVRKHSTDIGFSNSMDYSFQSVVVEPVDKKDNRVLAIIAMNGFSLC